MTYHKVINIIYSSDSPSIVTCVIPRSRQFFYTDNLMTSIDDLSKKHILLSNLNPVKLKTLYGHRSIEM